MKNVGQSITGSGDMQRGTHKMNQPGTPIRLTAAGQGKSGIWSQLLAHMNQSADSISDRAEEIRQQVAAGVYYVSSVAVAKAIVTDSLLVKALRSWSNGIR